MRLKTLSAGSAALLVILALHRSAVDVKPTAPRSVFPTDALRPEAEPGALSRTIGRVPAPIAASVGASGTTLRMSDSTATVFFGRAHVALALCSRSRTEGWGLHWGLVGAREQDPRPEQPLAARIHRLVGDPSTWQKDLPAYGSVVYPDARPGLDLRIESRPQGMEYSIHARAGADLRSLRWRYHGALSVEAIDGSQALRIRTGLGDLREDGLLAYQDGPAGRVTIPAWYETNGGDEYSIRLGDYDRNRPLVIDPVIGWSTLLGGDQGTQNPVPSDSAHAITRDASGFLYVTGHTQCTDLPIVGGFDPAFSGDESDAFVLKIDPTGPTIVWSSYLGGSRTETGFAIGVDALSNVYVAGQTESWDFPNSGGFDQTWNGSLDGFITKVNADGASLAWSTYIGGSVFGLAVTPAGDAYAVGSSTTVPTPGGFDPTPQPGGDGFILKLSTTGALVYGSYLSGSGWGVAVDASGSAYVTGATTTDGLATLGAYQTTVIGVVSSFAMKIAPNGGSVVWYTYLGGNTISTEVGRAIQIDGSGNVYVGGQTQGNTFTTAMSFGTTPLQNGAGFVAKLNPTGTALVWSVILGGSSIDVLWCLAVDSSQNVYVGGQTSSSDFPTAGGFQSFVGADGFVTKIAPDGGSLVWSSFLGGNWEDIVYDLVVDGAGNVFLAGDTRSSDFPTNGGFDTTYGAPPFGYGEAFVTKVNAVGTSLGWSSYYGGHRGASDDRAHEVAVDAAGNVYITGYSTALDFPVAGAWDSTLGGTADAFVSKISSSGNGVIWSTYVGGAGSEMGFGIAVDSSGNVFVAGATSSTDYPLVNAFDATIDVFEGFVSKLSPSGSSLLWSSFLGGAGVEAVRSLAVDDSGHVYVVGETNAGDFPGLAGGFDSTLSAQDAFVARIDDAGPSLAWTSFLGGSSSENAFGVAVDAAGRVYVSGKTLSTDFPIVGGFQAVYGGGTGDAFIVKINPAVPAIQWSSFLGGSQEDSASCLAVDAGGNVYVSGFTKSADFPVPGGTDASLGGVQDAFVAKINSSGASLAWSTYLGGGSYDSGEGIGVDASGTVVVAGNTTSPDFPVVNGSPFTSVTDAFGVALLGDTSTVQWSSTIGGRWFDDATGVAVRNGRAVISGYTSSGDFPSVGGFDTVLGYQHDGFLVQVDLSGSTGGGSGGGGGGCGLLGLDALLILTLLRRRVRP